MTYALRPFEVHRPTSVEEAVTLAARHPGAPYLAGGTDLMVNLRRRLYEPEHVIHLGRVEALRGVAQVDGATSIGALTTLRELAAHELVRQRFPVLAEAAGLVAGPTLRNMGTLGGNLCLDTRCRYYNQSHFWRSANAFCLKKDGTVCHVAPGGGFCWATYSGDTAPALMMLGAEVELTGPQGTRTVPLTSFHGKDGRWSIGTQPGGRQPGELLTRVRIPADEAGWTGVYEKLRVRDSIDYPLVGLGLMVRWDNPGDSRVIAGLRMALTAVNPRPYLVPGVEAHLGKAFTPEVVQGLQQLANRAGKPMRTTVDDPAYRRAMIGALVEKAALRLVPELATSLESRAEDR